MTSRLPAAVEVSALLRSVSAGGGFAAVLAKGDPDSGTILIVVAENGVATGVFERLPQADGRRRWHCARSNAPEREEEFENYLAKRRAQDRDLWLIELDIADSQRFIDSLIRSD